MEVTCSESQATLHPLFSHTLNGVERGGLSIMRSLSIRDCRIPFAKSFVHNSLMYLYIKSPQYQLGQITTYNETCF